MKYSIIKCINGNYFIHAEGITELSSAKAQFHALCHTLLNASDVITACVMIVDEALSVTDNYREYISHPVTTEV